MRLSKSLLTAFAAIATAVTTSAQSITPNIEGIVDTLETRYSFYSSTCSPEKLYLHIGRTYYTAGETVWFMGYLRNASPSCTIKESNFIYVEILDKEGNAVSRVKVKRDRTGFPGCIELPPNAAGGDYTLRAYTVWQLNNDDEYHFHQKIKVFSKNEEKKAKKSGLLKTDISFYPEGGRYFAGNLSNIAFKVMDSNGRSLDGTFEFIDSDGNLLSTVSTVHDGMGMLAFIPASGITYSLRDKDGKLYPLPAPSSQGASIVLRKSKDCIYIRICGPATGLHSLLVRDIASLKSLTNVTLDGNDKFFRVAPENFKFGINHLLLVNSSGNIVSERMMYVPNPLDFRTICKASTTVEKQTARGLIPMEISLRDSYNIPIDGHFSVSVVKKSFRRHLQNDGLLSYLRLSSELNGSINDPYYYFDNTKPLDERMKKLDLLMMVQGWKYYNLDKLVSTKNISFKFGHLREYVQSIKGRIERILSKKIPKKFIFTFLVPSQRITAVQEVDEGRNYIIDSLDLVENTGVFVKVERLTPGLEFYPLWKGDDLAAPFKYRPAPGYAAAVKAEAEEETAFAYDAAAYTLEAAVVTASSDPFDGLLSGRRVSSSDLEFYKDYTLIEYLNVTTPSFEYNGEQMYNRRYARSIHSGIHSGGDEDTVEDAVPFLDDEAKGGAVKLVVNNSEDNWWMYESVHLSDISAISVSTFPEASYGSNGGIVALKLKEGAVIRKADVRPSLLYFVPLGYQKPQYFYSPRYDRGAPDDGFDHRNTIYWNPYVKIDNGLTQLEFCDTDQMDGPYIVSIEGYTYDGIPFSARCDLVKAGE